MAFLVFVISPKKWVKFEKKSLWVSENKHIIKFWQWSGSHFRYRSRNKKSRRILCFLSASSFSYGLSLQTLQQNSELRRRLQRIHAESAVLGSITESTLMPSSYRDESLQQISLQTSSRRASFVSSVQDKLHCILIYHGDGPLVWKI